MVLSSRSSSSSLMITSVCEILGVNNACVGAENALKILTSGEHVNAKRALQMGIVDHVVEGDLLKEAITFCRTKVGLILCHACARGGGEERAFRTASSPS